MKGSTIIFLWTSKLFWPCVLLVSGQSIAFSKEHACVAFNAEHMLYVTKKKQKINKQLILVMMMTVMNLSRSTQYNVQCSRFLGARGIWCTSGEFFMHFQVILRILMLYAHFFASEWESLCENDDFLGREWRTRSFIENPYVIWTLFWEVLRIPMRGW